MQSRKRIWSPIACGVVILLVGIGVVSLLQLCGGTDQVASNDPTAEALAAVKSYLDASEFYNAYDALLVAMRLAPGDKQVFDASLEFVRKAVAIKDSNEEAILLAQDIHQRAANLLPFLALKQIKEARAAHTKAGDELYSSKKGTNPESPFAEAERLLTAARKASFPASARARLLHEVEAELNSQARRVASTTMKPEDENKFWEEWKKLKGRYEEAQKAVLAALYEHDLQPRVQAWVTKVKEFNEQRAEPGLDEINQVNNEIYILVTEGQRLSRDLTPYVEGGVEAAIKDNQGCDEHFNRLARLREWNYNRWALDRVDKVEKSGGSALDKLKSLAVIDETRLSPYVLQRFTTVWNKFFNELSEDDKVEATKLRILREYREDKK